MLGVNWAQETPKWLLAYERKLVIECSYDHRNLTFSVCTIQ